MAASVGVIMFSMLVCVCLACGPSRENKSHSSVRLLFNIGFVGRKCFTHSYYSHFTPLFRRCTLLVFVKATFLKCR